MIILCGAVNGPKWEKIFPQYPYLGTLLSPASWRTPPCQYWACDNDVFANREKPDWWCEKGEEAWLKMLPKVKAQPIPPMFVLLPDVVADWKTTVERAQLYGPFVKSLGLRTAIALQDGCDFEEALAMDTDVVFVGGSKAWKRLNTYRATKFFQSAGKWVHVGRCNPGSKTAPFLEYCLWTGVDSVDGTGYNRFSDAILPIMERSVNFWNPTFAVVQEESADEQLDLG